MHVSFVRSTQLDSWTLTQLRQMQVGSERRGSVCVRPRLRLLWDGCYVPGHPGRPALTTPPCSTLFPFVQFQFKAGGNSKAGSFFKQHGVTTSVCLQPSGGTCRFEGKRTRGLTPRPCTCVQDAKVKYTGRSATLYKQRLASDGEQGHIARRAPLHPLPAYGLCPASSSP